MSYVFFGGGGGYCKLMFKEGGAVIAHKARLLIACGGRGGREHPPLPYIQSNACRFLFLLFSYLRFAEAASFDKKEQRRSCTSKNYITFIQKIVTKLSKIWVWDPGSGKNLTRIPDPVVKKATDPGSGSATLGKTMQQRQESEHLRAIY
jgi:hypothetical protein